MILQELTNYQFDCEPKALHGALDRFAQFFLDPLCKADALEREVSAVDNEFAGAFPSEASWEMTKVRSRPVVTHLLDPLCKAYALEASGFDNELASAPS